MARFLRWPESKSDHEMSTGSTDRNHRREASYWYPRGVVLAAVGALALCIGSILMIRTTPAPTGPYAPPPKAPIVVDMEPFVPWTPDARVKIGAQIRPLREGPYTLKTDAPMLASGPGFISLLGNELNTERFYISQHSNSGGFLGGDWVAENVVPTADGVRMDVTPTGNPAKPYALAEVQVKGTYGYGRYEVIMRPAKGSGLVSAFFTYTGEHFGDPHDEIDIEFVGYETDVVELNYFRNGKTGKYAHIKLPFDAAEADHLYAFDWTPEGISWYVDGKLIYKTAEGDPQVPRTPGRIHFSNWTGIPAMQQWHGKPDFGDRGSAYYSCISFTPLGQNTRRCADVYQPGTRFPAPTD